MNRPLILCMASAALLFSAACGSRGVQVDAGTPDAGVPDAGIPDTGIYDAGVPDAGVPDAGSPDAGSDAGSEVSISDISPAAPKVSAGKTVKFSATVSGSTNLKVLWSTSGGAIDETGLFTAPSFPGQVDIFATADADRTKSVSTRVSVIALPSIGSFEAARKLVTSGESTTLVAEFTGGTATVDHGVGVVESGVPAGTGAISETTVFTVNVTNAAGDSVTATEKIEAVAAPEILSFTASPAEIPVGGAVGLKGEFINGAGAIEPGVGSVGSGEVKQVTVTADAIYTLTVTNAAQRAVSLPLTVKAIPQDNPASLSVAPGNGELTLSWKDPLNAGFDHVSVSMDGGEPIDIQKGVEKATFQGLTNYRSYSFLVKGVNAYGYKSQGETITAAPRDPEDSTLSELEVSEGALKPDFTGETTEYSLCLGWQSSTIEVTATPRNSHATMTINGKPAEAGKPVSLDLPLRGSEVVIEVVSESGQGSTAYSIDVRRGTGWSERVVPGAMSGQPYTGMAISSDGLRIATATSEGVVYLSGDGGKTWESTIVPDSPKLTSIAGSSDGSRLVAGTDGGNVYISTDGGKSFSKTQGVGFLVASSSDGMTLAANGGSKVQISRDGGITWVARGDEGLWYCLAVSPDGEIVASSEFNDNSIHISYDSGMTWLVKKSLPYYHNWRNLTFAKDGRKMIIRTRINMGVFISENFGDTWMQAQITGNDVAGLAMSGDGQTVAVLETDCTVHVSTDGGRSFDWKSSRIQGANRCGGIAMPPETRLMAVYQQLGYLYFSRDDGTSWGADRSVGSRVWAGVAVSSDGSKMAAAVKDGYIYTSRDYGFTWTERTDAGLRTWTSIASDSTGVFLFATVDGSRYGGGPWISTDGGESWMEIAYFRSIPNRKWSSASVTADGEKMATAYNLDNDARGYVSVTGGLKWYQITSFIAFSAYYPFYSPDGTVILSHFGHSSVYYSTDDGMFWIKIESLAKNSWSSLSLSNAATHITLTSPGGYIYTSDDAGKSFEERTELGMNDWTASSMGYDGELQAVASSDGTILVSPNFGSTWIPAGVEAGHSWTTISVAGTDDSILAGQAGKSLFGYLSPECE